MIPAWLLSPRLWASLALSAAVCGMVWWLDDNGFARGKAAVQVKFDEYKVKQEAAYNKLISDFEVGNGNNHFASVAKDYYLFLAQGK